MDISTIDFAELGRRYEDVLAKVEVRKAGKRRRSDKFLLPMEIVDVLYVFGIVSDEDVGKVLKILWDLGFMTLEQKWVKQNTFTYQVVQDNRT